MRKVLIVLILLLIGLLCAVPSFAQQSPVKFNKQEIKKMSSTTAVLETKFGNITLKFFPDVAPGM